MSTRSSLPVIAVIGSLNADLTSYTSRIPNGGETLHGTSFKTGSGGKGGNQACACAKLSRSSTNLLTGSATVKMVGAVGNDQHGSMLLKDLQATGVNTSGVVVKDDVETGVAIIIVEESSGENRILLNAGANYSISPLQFEELQEPYPDLIILQLEVPVETTVQILRAARKASVPVLLNPAPAVELPEEVYEGLDYLIVNESEVVILCGCSAEEIEDVENLPTVGRQFHEKGVKNVIVTLGGRGVFFSVKGGENGLVEAKKVEVVDTTAAGDTFVGAYALEVVKGEFNAKSAVEMANRAAALTIGKKGAQSSIPWADGLGGS
ncbi:ribokinase [Hyaloscypha bicolor E]|uniref:Ribokinase n=1 Tax=Hyaloscypha bicolor E TaxID=1095630 RepID=A0A2J6TAL0_9HELO|nr:ribokinase [Hyaloscypha bicolor E]PMD60002.1 ribokinase [Hyaloscypha bicolor E]